MFNSTSSAGAWGGDYCATDNGAATSTAHPGGNSKDGTRPTFVNFATGDLHLNGSDTSAKNEGEDLSSDPDYPFSDDFDGDARVGAWEIGADEVASVTASIVAIMAAYREY